MFKLRGPRSCENERIDPVGLTYSLVRDMELTTDNSPLARTVGHVRTPNFLAWH